ncbi:penicillin-binding protein 2 [Aurantiacibacter atlanticus]|uniref:Penicillin-binding protein 2 n=1 Tax=Aurantiacibacter atlanticus TaxID=1648404 RepID=A0A161IU50_9SPHN|nr:penicillin-binding protein 2 [Aurantiacibacter atlanticus]
MFFAGLQLGTAGLLAGRLAWLTIAENEKWQLLSESNRLQLSLIPPRRGLILDRRGQLLATNKSQFTVDLIPDRLQDASSVMAKLAAILELDTEDLERLRSDLNLARGHQPVRVASGIAWEDYAAISVHLPELKGVALSRAFVRDYPLGAAGSHLLGYVGAPSREEYEETGDQFLMVPGVQIGKDMLEKTLENRLAGKPGARRVEVTARGKVIRELDIRPDEIGETVTLTVDRDLQTYAARRLGPQSGSVVALDLETGGILAMASMPAYDPNSFSDGISQSEWDMLSQDERVPLRNKSLQGLYPPGSTIKPITALALLEEGVAPQETVVCTGRVRIGGGTFHCWRRSGHGVVDMNRAIAESCDIYFYLMGVRIGMQPIADMARRFGLGARYPDLPVPYQYYGTVPDPEWKQRRYGEPWQVYDTVNATIGQGYLLANPLQLAVMTARLASGRAVAPELLAEQETQAPSLRIDPAHFAIVRQGMSDVVNGRGTATRARLPLADIKLAGKTGTAQVRRITMAERRRGVRSNASLPWRLRDHGLFIGYAPIDRPRYAVAVVIEHGGGSAAAYPIASDVLLHLFDKELAMERLAEHEKDWGGGIEERMARETVAYAAQ